MVILLNNAKKNCAKLFITLFLLSNMVFASQDWNSVRLKGIELYSNQKYDEAYELLNSIPLNQKDEVVYLILSNIALEQGKDNSAISNLNKSLNKNFEYYKAYYNLGLIFASKKSNLLALDNFELAIKYNKDFAPAYYNLAYIQISLRDFKSAKKNLIKSIQIEPTKEAYYNLAYCYKELGKSKQAIKTLKLYDAMN